jgi:hypothetical protein
MVFNPHSKRDRQHLIDWLVHLDTILGANLGFDMLWLRFFPDFREALPALRHLLIDLVQMSYLENEGRSSHSLLYLGQTLGLFSYAEDVKKKAFDLVTDCYVYNGQDTHNTLLGAAEVATRILLQSPSDKLSPFCLQHYSDTSWSTVLMSEAGVPMDTARLSRIERRLNSLITTLAAEATSHGLLLSGEGSNKSKDDFFSALLDACPGARTSRMLKLTDKTRKVSTSAENREFLGGMLPPNHPLRPVCDVLARHTTAQKLLSTYIFPLLYHQRNHPENRRKTLI